MDSAVAEWLGAMNRDEAMERCLAAEVPVGPVNAVDEIFADPHFAAREAILRVADAETGEIAVPGVVPKLSRTPGRVERLGPALGEANEAVYGSLGLSPEEVAELARKGVV